MVQSNKIKEELKKLANSDFVSQLSKQFTAYEGRVKLLVKEFDVKSRDAREKGKDRLDQLTHHIKKTRSDIEKRVTSIVDLESKRLNKKVDEVFRYLKTLAKNDQVAEKVVKTKKSTKGRSANAGKKSTGKKVVDVATKPKAPRKTTAKTVAPPVTATGDSQGASA